MTFKDYSKVYRSKIVSPCSTWYTTYVSQGLSKYVTYLAYRIGMTPNMLTAASSLTVLLGVAFIAQGVGEQAASGARWVGVLGAAILQLSYVFDCSDGQVARLTKRGSPFGAFLDLLLDRANTFVVVGGLFYVSFFVSAPSIGPTSSSFVAAMLTIAAMVLFPYATDLRAYAGIRPKESSGQNRQTLGLAEIPFQFMDTGVIYLLLSIGTLAGFGLAVLYAYGILSAGALAGLVFLSYRQVMGQDASRPEEG